MDLKVEVTKKAPRKWCASAAGAEGHGPETCASSERVAVGRALAAFGQSVRKGAAFGALKPLRERGSKIRSAVEFKVTPTSPETAKPVPIGHGRQGAKAEIYVTQSLQHGEIAASGRGGSSYYSPARACLTAKDGKHAGAARRGQVDLVFVPQGVPISKHSTRPPGAGPALRFCSKAPEGGFGPVLAVRDPREAQEIAHKYQACAKDPKADLDRCIQKAVGKKAEALPVGAGVGEPTVGAFGKLKSYPPPKRKRRR